MAIAATAGGAASNGSSVASLALTSFNIAASRHTVVTIALGSTASSVTSITDTKGNTYTQQAAVNGTGVRTEIWACANSGAQTANIITINISPNTSIAACAEEYSGVGSFGNTATVSGSSTFAELYNTMQEAGNFAVAGIGFACVSGDTLTAIEGTSRRSSIPAATAVGNALYDASQNGNGQVPNEAKISTSRNWAIAGLELRSSGASAVSYFVDPLHLPVLSSIVLINGNLPLSGTFSPSHFNPVPVAAVLAGGTTGSAYNETIGAQGGTGPYTFAVTSGSLPTGTSLTGSTGMISGTTSAAATFTFTITVTDSLGYTGSQSFSITIAAPAGAGASNYGWVS